MKQIPRRTFLQGVGTAIALPMLDSALPSFAAAEPASKTYANRMVFLYVPNGVHMQDWRPPTEGKFELPYILEPLKNVKNELTIITGLAADKARPNGDGPGDHARALAAILTGCQPRKTPGADIKVGISADQLAAQIVGKKTRFPSLELGIDRGAQAGNCDSGYSCAYSSNISWSSESTPVAKEVNPRLVFERLFTGGSKKAVEENQAKRERYRKSIIDFVVEDTNRLKSTLGVSDQRKLDEYLTGIREIERRIMGIEARVDLPAGFSKPGGIPEEYDEHLRIMLDMMVLAFQGDLTRIATFMFANEGSNRSYKSIGIPEGHHDLSHHGNESAKQEKIREINKFHTTQLAYFLEKMKSTREGDASMLDHSMVVYCSGISDGNQHNHDDLPVLLAGSGCGTIKTGRHMVYTEETPINNLWVSMIDRMGAHPDLFGDATGRVELT